MKEYFRASQVDSLRAFAVIAVIISHWIPDEYNFGIDFGREGVLLFFVISGYLITGIIYENYNKNMVFFIKSFYIRRALRIFPAYFFLLSVLFISDSTIKSTDFIFHALFLSNILFFYEDSWLGSVSHFWSLSVEEQFYLIWPAIFIFSSASAIKYLPIIALTLSVLASFLLSIFLVESTMVPILPIVAFHGVAVGAFLNISEKQNLNHKYYLRISWIIGVLILLSFYVIQFPDWFGVVKVIGVLFIFYSVVGKAVSGFTGFVGAFLECRALIFVGKLSYGIYLYHNFAPSIVRFILPLVGLPIDWKFGVSGLFMQAVITMAVSIASWYFLEKPINGLKRYFPYSRSASRCDLQ